MGLEGRDPPLFSKESAQWVVNALVQFFFDHRDDYIVLETVTFPGTDTVTCPHQLRVRLMEAPGTDGFSFSQRVDGSETLHCISDTGRKVDIDTGFPDERGIGLAEIYLEPELRVDTES